MDPKQQPQQPQQQPQQQQGYFVVNTAPYGYPAQQPVQATPYPVAPVPDQNAYYFANPTTTPQPQPAPQYYMPQQQPVYVYDPHSQPVHHDSLPVLIPSGLPARDRLKMKEFEVTSGRWFEEAWDLFKAHWLPYVLFTCVFIGVQFIPYVGSILGLALSPGFFIAGSHDVRRHDFKIIHFFHGMCLFFPIFAITFIYSLVVCVGLFLCIIPGIYFMIAYSFAIPIYIEYREEGVGIIDSLNISRHVISKNWWSVFAFVIVQFIVVLIGCLLLGVGVLVMFPVACLMGVVAFRDIFGFSEKRTHEKSVVCC